MHSALLDEIRQLFAAPGCIGLLGLCEEDGCVVPRVFTDAEDAARLVPGPKWPLAKTAWRMARSLPEGTSVGLVCRGCDMRALEELVKAAQLRPGAVRTIGLPCSAEQAAACLCDAPYPPGGDVSPGVAPMSQPVLRELCLEPGRLDLWREHFKRCIKCYGCRNACPICTCPSCKLEDGAYVTTASLPPDPLAFHLIRAMHLADRCVGCGACQESCPSGLPLLALHLSLRNALRERTGYVSGTASPSPLLTMDREEGLVGSGKPCWEDTLKDRKPGGNEHAG